LRYFFERLARILDEYESVFDILFLTEGSKQATRVCAKEFVRLVQKNGFELLRDRRDLGTFRVSHYAYSMVRAQNKAE